MKVAFGCDHGGFVLRDTIVALLAELGHELNDCGTKDGSAVDYPDIAAAVCRLVVEGGCRMGILVCGTGIGISMAANRNPAIRAALCTDGFSARMSREHNDANILCLGGRVTGPGVAEDIVRTWLAAEFAGGRHLRRISLF